MANPSDERTRTLAPSDATQEHTTPTTPAATANAPPGYEILGELGRGGMGVVYKARQVGLDRVVALKMVLAGAHASDAQRQRFLAEARAVAALQHPNIVQVFEIGTVGELPFFSLEFVPGGTLGDRVREAPLPPRTAARLVEQLARGMAYAHAQGIVHRDLKPDNVLLTQEGSPKITDFGLAKQLGSEEGPTTTGAVMGTPAYMAPEQALGATRHVGPAADVWALGAILYRLLTGRPPFQAATAMETMRQVVNAEPVAVRQLNPAVPRDLETIVLKCLAKEPHKRYASAEDLADDLERYLAGRPIQARPVGALERGYRWVRRNPVVASLAAAVVLVLTVGATAAGLLAWWALSERDKAAANEQTAIRNGNAALEAKGRADANARKASDNEKRALDALDLANKRLGQVELTLYAEDLARAQRAFADGHGGRAVEILAGCQWDLRDLEHRLLWARYNSTSSFAGHTRPASALAFRPDGRQFASAGQDGTVRVWDLASGDEVVVFQGHTGAVSCVAYTPDGTRIVSGGGDDKVKGELKVWDATTGRVVFSLDGHTNRVAGVAVSGDGKHILSGSWDRTLKVWDAATGKELRTLSGHTGQIESVTLSPADTRLSRVVSVGNDGMLTVWDAGMGKEVRSQRIIGSARPRCLAIHPRGPHVAGGCLDRTVRVWDLLSGRELLTLHSPSGPVGSLAYSPDGKHLVAAGYQPGLHVWDTQTGREIRTFPNGSAPVAYSPDGKQILSGGAGLDPRAAQQVRSNDVRLWDTDRGDETGNLALSPGGLSALAVHPDGARFCVANSTGDFAIWEPASGRRLLGWRANSRIGVASLSHLSYSPAGRRLVSVTSRPRQPSEATVWDAATGEALVRLDAGVEITALAWDADGRALAGGSQRVIRIWDTAAGRQLRSFPGPRSVRALAYHPDGKALAVAESLGPITLFDPATGAPLRTLDTGGTGAGCLAFSADGRRLVSGGDRDRAVRVWDTETGDELLGLSGHTHPVRSVAFSADGRRILSAGRTIKIWDAAEGRELLTLASSANGFGHATFCPAVERIVASDGVVRYWDGGREPEVKILAGHTRRVTDLAFSPDGAHLLSCAGDAQGPGEVRLWSLRKGRQEFALKGHAGFVHAVAVRPDGRRLASVGGALNRPGEVLLWDAETGTLARSLQGHPERVRCLAYSPDSTRLATGSHDRTVKIWDTATAAEVATFKGHSQAIVGVAFSPDGKRVVSLSADSSRQVMLKVWDADTGGTIHTLGGHGESGTCVGWSPAGNRIASGGGTRDGKTGELKFWDPETGRELLEIAHPGRVLDLAFSPDGKYLATACWDFTVRLWEVETGREVEAFKGLGNVPVLALGFSPDGKQIVAGCNTELRFWDLPTE